MSIEKKLEEAKDIFLSGVDEETYADNLNLINDWEKSIQENKAFAEWQQQDISIMIMSQARQSYKDFSTQLAFNRELTEAQRASLYAKQDACLFLIGLGNKDAKSELQRLESDISKSLNNA